MNMERSRKNSAAPKAKQVAGISFMWLVRIGLLAALGAWVALLPPEPQSAQRRFKEHAVKVTAIVSNGGVVSITADGLLTRAQTFQTPGWFHVVIVNGQTDLGRSAPGGVRVQRVSESLEILVPLRTGASVTVHPRGNRLDLRVEGGSGVESSSEMFAVQESAPAQPSRAQKARTAQDSAAESAEGDAAKRSARAELAGRETPPRAKKEQVAETSSSARTVAPNGMPPASAPPVSEAGQGGNAAPVPAAGVSGARQASESSRQVPAAAAQLEVADGSWVSGFLFSSTGLLVVLGVFVLAGAFVAVRRRGNADKRERARPEKISRKAEKQARKLEKAEGAGRAGAEETSQPFEQFKGDRRKQSVPVASDRRAGGRGAENEALRQVFDLDANALSGNGDHAERRESKHSSFSQVSSVVYGAYRIDQEVSHLVHGWAHSVEVLSSRAADDRRAVETSLLKALRAPETDEDGRRRARTALEDYGFVARQNATLLLASNGYERTAAARTLGEMRSSQALSFLTEALYDWEPVVRTEAVKSLGALGLPSALGAMLDIARRHPELPATILGPALTACSVESLDTGWSSQSEGVSLAEAQSVEQFVSEMRAIEPAKEVKQLPEWFEDETLQDALDRLESADVEARIISAQSLATFQVRRAVEALTALAVRDEAAAVRATAVTALGSIDHESVFAPVLIGMADESREVRAAAARTLSRLSFERADAYMHVAETADRPTLNETARACVKAGLAAQAVSRLASDDRRQAYEAFSLLSLVVKGGEAQAILDAVEGHQETEVRLAAVHLLGLMDDPEIAARLEMIAEQGSPPEMVRAAIREAVGRVARVRQEVFEH